MSRWILAVAALALLASPVSAQYIGIFMDREATTWCAEVGSTPFVDLHVVAVLGGDVTIMTGAQFKITGTPPGWTPENALWVPDAGAGANIGHPLFPTPTHPQTPGVNTVFSSCLSFPEGGRVPLGRIILLGAPTPANVTLRVEYFDLVPPDPDCPFVTACAPDYHPVCVGGGEIVLNGDKPYGCHVPVATPTWTVVKTLYR